MRFTIIRMKQNSNSFAFSFIVVVAALSVSMFALGFRIPTLHQGDLCGIVHEYQCQFAR